MKQSSSEPLEEKPTNEDVIKILGLTSTEEERTFFIKGYEYAKEKDNDELLLMVQDLEGYKSVVSSLESELKALKEEADRLKSELLDRDINQLPEKDAEFEALREERDKFAIGFLKWMSSNAWQEDASETFWYTIEYIGQWPPKQEATIQELLEQFKANTLNTEKN